MGFSSYEQACAAHRWEVPERYNIAQDVCDKHPPEKLAMVWERFDGARRELTWGELQALANQAAWVLRDAGVGRGDRVAVVLPPTPETAAVFFGVVEARGDPAVDERAVRGRGDPASAGRRGAGGAGDGRSERGALRGRGRAGAGADERALLAGAPTDPISADTAADDPAQLYYTSGTTGLAKGIVHAHRYLLAHEEFVYCHEVEDGERFHGMGEWAWAAGIAPLLGPWRLGAVQYVFQRSGGFDPHEQLAFLSRNEVTNVFTTPTAMRSMMGIADAGSRYPCAFRRVCSAGEPLNPEAIRWFREQYGVTVLDFYGLTESYPLVANYPFMEVREGSMGRPMPGWDVAVLDEDERPVGVGERGEICLRARSNPHYPLGYWRNEEAARETFGGEWFHTKDAASLRRGGVLLVRGPRRRRDHLRRISDRPVRGRVGVPGAPGGARGGGGRFAGRAARDGGEGVRGVRGRVRRERRSGRGDQGPRALASVGVRVSPARRVRRRAAEDADRQDPPDRAAAGGGGAGARGRRRRQSLSGRGALWSAR